MQPEQEDLRVHLYTENGGRSATVDIEAYLSKNGMVTISLSQAWVQMSPLVAKQFVERLQTAVEDAMTQMLVSDANGSNSLLTIEER
jgi:hypothetical protein